MEFVFWQNVVSIHQSAFLKALSEAHEVTLVAAEYLDSQRKGDGWDVPSMGDVRIIVSPTEEDILQLMSKPDVNHVFSGIDAYPMVFHAFKEGVKRGVKVSVFLEPYDWRGFKGFVRRIKYCLLFKLYGNRINHIFTTGNTGIKAYLKAGASQCKLHQWGYFTEDKNVEENVDPMVVKAASNPSLLFVGRLDENKNIISVLNIFPEIQPYVDAFDIVGRGPLEDVVREKAKCFSKIKVHGMLQNEEVQRRMSRNDYLILPSKYDGWGAVVNEALSQGMRVLCSDTCGAEILLDGAVRGEAFPLEKMKETLIRWLKFGPLSCQTRREIKSWSREKLSGCAAAKYFVQIIEGKDVTAPWID